MKRALPHAYSYVIQQTSATEASAYSLRFVIAAGEPRYAPLGRAGAVGVGAALLAACGLFANRRRMGR